MQLRDYQLESVEKTFEHWARHPGADQIPILWLPTAAGKSVICAGIIEKAFREWPEHHPRSLVIVPSKELAEQNAEKLAKVLPDNVRLGFYSASVGKKQPDADVIVATIGSVAKAAHVLGNIKLVVVDECHLISPDGAGMYRTLLRDLSKYCRFRAVGMTATPFRGNGIWLTDGKDPLFTGIAHEVPMKLLLERGYLSPLVRPSDVLETIDTTGIRTSAGDYNVAQLAERVDAYLACVATQAVQLAADRKKWIAFTPNVATAHKLADLLTDLGSPSQVVTGDTPKQEREAIIDRFRQTNDIRCLVTVLALSTGFDVPSVDCIVYCRPTRSPVLFVQAAGRGMRISPETGKVDCLWLDFTDTTARMGPIDQIRGRARAMTGMPGLAPFAVCDNCGAQVVPASLLRCPECDHLMREPEEVTAREVSDAPVMSNQVEQKIVRYEITNVTYERHNKPGRPPSMRVEYWSGPRAVANEFICFEHGGYAASRAYNWWTTRAPGRPGGVDEALDWIRQGCPVARPTAIHVNETGKYPEVVKYEFEPDEKAA